MNVTEFHLPQPHIIIDDFFHKKSNEEIIEAALKLKPKVSPVYRGGKDIIDIKIKRARDATINDGPIFEHLNFLWSKHMQNVYRESRDPIFRTLNHTTKHKIHLIKYEDEDFYDWHKDLTEGLISLSYMFCKQPQSFEGGNFVLKWREEEKEVEFQNNRLVIFPCDSAHRVTPVKMKTNNTDYGRYTVQVWPFK